MKRGLFLSVATLLIISLTLAAGCRRGAPIQEINSKSFPATHSKFTAPAVEDAIVRAGTEQGWEITPVKPGEMQGMLVVRAKHTVRVSILYDVTQKNYSIRYKDSSNMEYNPTKKIIHPNYNKWVQTLDRNIDSELSKLQ